MKLRNGRVDLDLKQIRVRIGKETCCWRATCSLSRVACFRIASIHRTNWRFFDGIGRAGNGEIEIVQRNVFGILFYFILLLVWEGGSNQGAFFGVSPWTVGRIFAFEILKYVFKPEVGCVMVHTFLFYSSSALPSNLVFWIFKYQIIFLIH